MRSWLPGQHAYPGLCRPVYPHRQPLARVPVGAHRAAGHRRPSRHQTAPGCATRTRGRRYFLSTTGALRSAVPGNRHRCPGLCPVMTCQPVICRHCLLPVLDVPARHTFDKGGASKHYRCGGLLVGNFARTLQAILASRANPTGTAKRCPGVIAPMARVMDKPAERSQASLLVAPGRLVRSSEFS